MAHRVCSFKSIHTEVAAAKVAGGEFLVVMGADLSHPPDHDPERSIPATTGRQLFGMDALMYNYWLPPEQAAGRDILVVAERREFLAEPLFAGKVGGIGKICSFEIQKHGKAIGSYYYRLLTGFNPAERSKPAGSIPLVAITMKAGFAKKESN